MSCGLTDQEFGDMIVSKIQEIRNDPTITEATPLDAGGLGLGEQMKANLAKPIKDVLVRAGCATRGVGRAAMIACDTVQDIINKFLAAKQ